MRQAQLKALYDKYNKICFDNKLPSTTVIKITRGHKIVACAIDYYTGSYSIHFYKTAMLYHLNAAKMGKKWAKNFSWETILLHEMIHIGEYVRLIKWTGKCDHGNGFEQKLNDIEKITGIEQYREYIK